MTLKSMKGVHNKATSETNSLKNMISGYRKWRRGVVGRRKKVVAEQRKWNECSRFQHSCYCSLFWLSEDLTEPWPLCQQHEEVVRQTHNKTWCSWVLRNQGWGERSACSLCVCLCFWHCTSGHHHISCAPQTPLDCLSTIRPHVNLNLFLKEWVASFSKNSALMRKTPPNPINSTTLHWPCGWSADG